MPLSRLQHWYPWIAVLVLIGVILGVYSPGLHGPFMFDDYINIVDNPDVAVRSLDAGEIALAASSEVSSRLGRPLSYISFGLNHYAAGGFESAFPFKLTNVIIHGINALLVLQLARLLFGQLARHQRRKTGKLEMILPLLAATLWALHPIQLTSVLYVVQRMTSLSALFVLAGLIAYVSGRQQVSSRPGRGIALMAGGILGGISIGLLAKENAILLLPYALVIEVVLFQGRGLPWRASTIRRTAYAFAAGIAFLVPVLWFGGQLDWITSGYQLRSFTLTERLLTEARVIWFYLGLLFVPEISRFTLYHDDFQLSTGWLSPWTTLPAVLGLAGLLAAGVILRRRNPMLAFALLWFLAGHSLESGVIALELVHEHRNYLPSLGPLMAAVCGLAALARGRYRRLLGVGATLAAVLAFSSFVLATNWRDEAALARFMLRHHPDSARSHEAMAGIYLWRYKDPVMAMEHYRLAAEFAPHETGYLLKLVRTAAEVYPGHDVAVSAPGTPPAASSPKVRKLLRAEVHDQRTVLVVDREIRDRIGRQLASQPIMGGAHTAFSELVGCIIEKPSQCGHLREETAGWLKIAIDNPRAPTKIRLQMMQLLVRLHIESGRLAEALALAERALGIAPSNPALILMHSNVLFLSGKLDAAEHVLTLFEGSARPGYENEWQQAEYLRSLIRQRRSR